LDGGDDDGLIPAPTEGVEEAEEADSLGSELDDNDDEPETDDLVLCQFEKVTRIKTKHKCSLKDGIMHLNGRDYHFHKATGEFEF
jgi:transcription initiation factor TFIIA large subunit